jgi:hypothetical protein
MATNVDPSWSFFSNIFLKNVLLISNIAKNPRTLTMTKLLQSPLITSKGLSVLTDTSFRI